jgi:beta-lactamase superfamily II metal-dependent hydrolase
MKKLNFTKELKLKTVLVGVLFVLLVLSFFFSSEIETALKLNYSYAKNQVSSNELESSDFKVNYLNVGQGNSTFIELPDGKTVLIDSDSANYGSTVAKFISAKGITQIDYLIATHADSDHIGGFDYILKNFEVKQIFRPFQIAGTGANYSSFVVYEDEDLASVYYDYVSIYGNSTKISRVTTTIYKQFISSIYSETYEEDGVVFNSKVTVFYDGLEISGNNYKIQFFAPEVRSGASPLELSTSTFGYATVGYGASDSNGNSAIFLVSIGSEKFFFSGDAPWTSGSSSSQSYEEEDFVNGLSSDEKLLLSNVSVYLVGHHGSSYSSGLSLLNLIKPKFSVISVGEYNSYGHPTQETLNRLASTSHSEQDYLLRTDEMGNIVFGLVDGKLKYSLEQSENVSKFYISWFELGGIIFVFAVVLIFSISPTKRKSKNY